jgi:hypothetical protein
VKPVVGLALLLSFATCADAQTRQTPIRDAVEHVQATRAPLAFTMPPLRAAQSQGSWPARHAVLLGTLVGFGAGFSIGYATCKYPGVEGPCDYYTYPDRARMAGGLFVGGIGAGIGAAVGAVIGAVRH